MKRNWRNNLIAWLALVFLGTACHKSGDHAGHREVYTCPMHATVRSDKPGVCPVCGMNLVHQTRTGEEVKITEDLAKILSSPNENVTSSVATQKGEFKTLPVSIAANGIVTYDPRYVYTLSTRIEGRLERTDLKYIFQRVRKGQRVAEIYSPALMTAQRELLYLLENDPGRTELIESAKNKLQRMGASTEQVGMIVSRKEPFNTFSIYSPYDGYVIADDQQAPSVPAQGAAAGERDMNGSSSGLNTAAPNTTSTASGSIMKNGSYVSAGQPLFRIVNTAAVRLELVLAGATVRAHDDVTLSLGGGRTEQAKVDAVQPFFTDGEEFMKVRVIVKGQDLYIGQWVQATIHLAPVEALWLPKGSVLNLGQGNVVFVKERGVFTPRNVTTGVRAGDWIAIKHGLASTDEVAKDAHYLVDSESFINSK